MSADYGQIARNGLWSNNGVFTMLLGLCPAMAMTTSATNGLAMGLATAAVMTASLPMASALRKYITPEIRIPVFVLILATNVTMVDLLMNAWMHELYKVLGLFIPLIVANCLPFARLELFASREPVLPSLADGVFMGLGFTLALTLIGAGREILGAGTLFADASLLLGPGFQFLETRIMPAEFGALMMILPPGGFLMTGLLVVVKRLIDARADKGVQLPAAQRA